jgi:outer membrane protein OmpA-like peptidoglycan-associated protein
MFEVKKERRLGKAAARLATRSVLLSAIFVAGCSSVGDAINPVHWYNGVSDWISGDSSDRTAASSKAGDDKQAAPPSLMDRTDLPEGLAADLANAKHVDEPTRREGNATRPLTSDAGAKPTTSVVRIVQPSTPAASGLATGGAMPAASGLVTGGAMPTPPQAEPAPVPPPEAAPSPEAPAKVGPSSGASPLQPGRAKVAAAASPAVTIEKSYSARLVVSSASAIAAPVVRGKALATSPSYRLAGGPGPEDEEKKPLRSSHAAKPAREHVGACRCDNAALISRGHVGVRPLDSYRDGHVAASFQVGTVSFGEGTSALPRAEVQRLKDIAQLYRERGGTVRVLGFSASARLDVNPQANQEANRQLATRRAQTVARELVRLGVPGQKIYAGSALALGRASLWGGAPSNDATEIYIDY